MESHLRHIDRKSGLSIRAIYSRNHSCEIYSI